MVRFISEKTKLKIKNSLMGHIVSEETKKKMRKGINVKCDFCGKEKYKKHSWAFRTEQGNHFCSRKCNTLWHWENNHEGMLKSITKRDADYRKENHWNWQGGIANKRLKIANSKEYKKWRALVFERDNYICQYCNKKGGNLEAHHKFPFAEFPDFRLEVWNGITLCEECHKKTKSIRIKNGIKFLEEYAKKHRIKWEEIK